MLQRRPRLSLGRTNVEANCRSKTGEEAAAAPVVVVAADTPARRGVVAASATLKQPFRRVTGRKSAVSARSGSSAGEGKDVDVWTREPQSTRRSGGSGGSGGSAMCDEGSAGGGTAVSTPHTAATHTVTPASVPVPAAASPVSVKPSSGIAAKPDGGEFDGDERLVRASREP